MSNAALTPFINPAVGGREDHIQLRSNLGTTAVYTRDNERAGYEPVQTHLGLSFTYQRFRGSFSAENVTYNWFNDGPHRLQSFRLQAGYLVYRNLAVGTGIGINRRSLRYALSDVGFSTPSQQLIDLSFDAGLYYNRNFNMGIFNIQSEMGLSLNNIGSYEKTRTGYGPKPSYSPQAGKLHWSWGLGLTSLNEWRGRSWFGAGVYAGWSKYFARQQNIMDGRGSGFSDLFTHWGAFESRYNRNDRVSAFEQISLGLATSRMISITRVSLPARV
jgi:hypothetical protein